jgi:hypothetical protein
MLDETNLTLWVFSGGTWTKITPIGVPVISASAADTDRYIEVSAAKIDGADNAFALMYTPPTGGGGTVTYNFKNTKIFNPNSQTARIFYTQNVAAIGPLGGAGNVKIGIFAINGSPVRTLTYQDPAEYAAVFNPAVNREANFNNLSELNYFFTWDGKNDKGKTVLNGIYIVKIEITTAAGVKSRLSRAIAVVK